MGAEVARGLLFPEEETVQHNDLASQLDGSARAELTVEWKLLIFKQILFASVMGNVERTIWKIYYYQIECNCVKGELDQNKSQVTGSYTNRIFYRLA